VRGLCAETRAGEEKTSFCSPFFVAKRPDAEIFGWLVAELRRDLTVAAEGLKIKFYI
jgi:hypothetical protein